MSSLHVLHVVSGLEMGGLERLVSGIVLHERGADLAWSILKTGRIRPDGDSLSELEVRLRKAGVSIHSLPFWGAAFATFPIGFRKLVRKHKVTLVHCHLPIVGPVCHFSLLGAGVPCVVTMHNMLQGTTLGLVRGRILDRLSVASGETRTAVSKAVRDHFVRRYGFPEDIVRVIPNGIVGPDDFAKAQSRRSALRKEMGISEGQNVILNVGSLRPSRGGRELCRIAAELENVEPSRFRVIHAGRTGSDGTDGLRVEGEPAGSVTSLGPRTDVAELMAASDAYVCTSHSEGFSLAVGEALMNMLPVVTTDIPGVVDTYGRSRFAAIVPVGEPIMMAHAIRAVVRDIHAARERASVAKTFVETELSMNLCRERYLQLYRELLK